MIDTNGQSPLRPGSVKGPRDNPKRADLQRKPEPEPEQKKPDPAVTDDADGGPEPTELDSIAEESTQEKIQETLEKLLQRARTPLTAEQKSKMYEVGLKNAGVTKEKARRVMDNTMLEGYHEEEYTIGGRFKLKLRTRNYNDVQRALRFAEAEAPRLPLHIDDILCRYNLAASLSQYHETSFNFPEKGTKEIEAAFDERYEFIMQLATPVAGRLNSCLMEFDTMMNAILADGAPENF